jgi:hypothetical protein
MDAVQRNGDFLKDKPQVERLHGILRQQERQTFKQLYGGVSGEALLSE